MKKIGTNRDLFLNIKIRKNVLIMYQYMICCKLKLNLHGNNKLHMYWTYSKKILLKYLWYFVN